MIHTQRNDYSRVGEMILGIALAVSVLTNGYAQESTGPSNGNQEESSDPHVSKDVRFLASQECALCHASSQRANAMRDAQGNTVAPYDLWSGSMMANSARDPYWRAAVSAEVHQNPLHKQHIEELCTRCHTPMAAPVPDSPPGSVLDFLHAEGKANHLGSDGVSCTVCHQISAEGLGSPESFTGGFVYNHEGLIYGPHADPVTMPMQRHVGYTPTKGDHILSSELCATCHTVITESVAADGAATGHMFHEQAPYLEWRNSIFSIETTGKSCQDCHVPQVDANGQRIATMLAHNPGGRDFPFLRPRQPFGQHLFAGGNVFMLKLLRDQREALDVTASTAAFDRSIAAAQNLLSKQTADLEISRIATDAEGTHIELRIETLSGHKFPTAYPSRRAWLEVIVTDSNGSVHFSSGVVDAQGRLIDQSGAVLSSELANGNTQPHYDRINHSSEVQIYETLMNDSDGQLTFSLVRGDTFRKDNRLLPKGWTSDHADGKATKPIGVESDANFLGGEDHIEYLVTLPPGEYRVTASLLFQSLSARYMEELFEHSTAEVIQFRKLYNEAVNLPEVIATQAKSIQVVP